MPPLNKYTFRCVSDAKAEIIIQTYGDERNAVNLLNLHVKDFKNWKLNKD